MSYHEFALFYDLPPRDGEYLPYDPTLPLLKVPEETADWLFPLLEEMPSFYQNLGQPGRGFDMAGITLIPPDSLPLLRAVCLARQKEDPSLGKLAQLCQEGMENGVFLLHYGL